MSGVGKNLCNIVDENLSLKSHVNLFCETAVLKNIGGMRKYLGQSTVKPLVHTFVVNSLDHSNNCLYWLP